MSDFTPLNASPFLTRMRELHEQILALPAGSAERRMLEQQRASFIQAHARGEDVDVFDVRKAAANDL